MKLGDFVKKVLSPFVKGSKYEHCDDCEKRRVAMNRWSDKLVAFFTKITCPCWWRRIFKITK